MNLPTARFAQSGTLRTESPVRDLEAIIRSRTPLIAVESNEEPQIVGVVREISRRLQMKAYRWTITEGLQVGDKIVTDGADKLREGQKVILLTPGEGGGRGGGEGGGRKGGGEWKGKKKDGGASAGKEKS